MYDLVSVPTSLVYLCYKNHAGNLVELQSRGGLDYKTEF